MNDNLLSILSHNSQVQLTEALNAIILSPVELALHGGKTHCIAYISQIDKDRNEYLWTVCS